jgi:Amt family ammonium transporter
MFAALTPALAIGAAAERARLLPMIIFIFIWSTLVYNLIAYWTWNPNGWSAKLGAIDFAGGVNIIIYYETTLQTYHFNDRLLYTSLAALQA